MEEKRCNFDEEDFANFIEHFVIEMEEQGYTAWHIGKVLAFVLGSLNIFDEEVDEE